MIGNNSCGVHSIMAGKTDDNIDALEILTYDGQRLHVGATSADDFDRFIREGGRRAEIYTGLKSLADRYGEQVRRQFPNIPRRVSGYNLNHLLPRAAFTWRGRWSVPKAPASPFSKPRAGWSKVRQRVCCSSSHGLTFISAPTTSRRSWSIAPSASKVLTTSWSEQAAARA